MSKFKNTLDEYVYQVSLEGLCDDECGNVNENGIWYGLMLHGRTIFRDHDPSLGSLSEEDKTKLMECAGVIIEEDSYGFVGVTYFKHLQNINAKWAYITETVESESYSESVMNGGSND